MPLKIRVKPEQKFFAGGAVLKNVGTRPADLLVLSDSPVLREGYMMNIARSEESDAATVYFLLQMIYLFKGKGQPLDNLVIDTIDKFALLYPHLGSSVNDIIALLRAGESFKALRLGQELLSDHEAAKLKQTPSPATQQISAV
ncbi:MAG: flagellar biosynthesis repressor FlbT [Alphaproteobacteria bacterium]